MDIEKLNMKEISFDQFEGLRIGHAVNEEAATGCTVLVAENGMAAGVDVRGGGPASRETTLLQPLASAEIIHSIVLSGGSAFGLEAGCGVAEFLEEKGIGFDTGFAKIPLVCQSCIYDLGIGSSTVRPDKQMGYDACADAFEGKHMLDTGNVGAGIGATVGKARAAFSMMKSGLGMYALQFGRLKVGAIVVVNALGDIYDCDTHEKIAGLRSLDGKGFEDCETALLGTLAAADTDNMFTANTTIGVIVTNAKMNKMELQRTASAGHNAYARTIRPVHTSADGDSIYAASIGSLKANIDVVSAIGTEVMARAVNNAVYSAEEKYGVPSAKSMKQQNR